MSTIGLELVREDMGLEYGDHLLMDPQYTDEELRILNMEVTPEIEHILKVALFAKAFEDLSRWENIRAEENKIDFERALWDLIEVQSKMSKLMQTIAPLEEKRKHCLNELQSWVNRYNTWQASAEYDNYPHKQQAAKLFFNGLCSRKEAYQDSKSIVAPLWEKWNILKAEVDEIVGTNLFLWVQFFELSTEEIHRYFCTGETEEVDDYTRLTKNQHDVSDLLLDMDLVDRSRDTESESYGIGFWDFSVERGIRKASYRKVEQDCYWEGVVSAV